jgi:4-alpha-glucanotransferase
MTGRHPLQQRADQAGLQVRWTDVAGVERDVAWDVVEAVLLSLQGNTDQEGVCPPLLTCIAGQALRVPAAASGPAHWVGEQGAELPAQQVGPGQWLAPATPGYWHWRQGDRLQGVAVAPLHAWFPDRADGRRHWGISTQVYSVPAAGDGGIGDSGGIAAWLPRVQRHGGDAIGLSPIHANMPIRSGFSPYSPSDRRWLEPLHGAPLQQLAEAARAVRAADPRLDADLALHEAAGQIDWAAAAAAKWQWIGRLPAWLQTHRPGHWQLIESEMSAYGAPLASWASQTAALSRTPASVQAFGQWLVQSSWHQVQRDARERGMAIGLIADLAIGFDPAGVEAHDNAGAVLQGLELGAPPDAFNPHGQAWGITGYAPRALRAQGYAPFISLLRAVMARRGGVRIDHILGLLRLWVLPRGAGAGQGIYLRCPFDDLLNLLVLESWRHRCVVIGEDLGVVPPGIRDALASRGVLGMDVLAFSRDGQGFLPASQWRASAVAMSSTHDLPPVAGWLQGRDLQWRRRLGWTGEDVQQMQLEQRQAEVRQLAAQVQAEGLDSGDLQRDALAFTARTPSVLALLPLEDAAGIIEQPNLPGTVDEHPNWRQRLLLQDHDDALDQRLSAFAAQRMPAVRA